MVTRAPQLNQAILIIILGIFAVNVASNISVPVFALYVTNDVGAAAASLGILSAVYWIVKSLLQLPIARAIDRQKGEIDDYLSLLLGLAISATGVFLFFLATQLWHLFLIQLLIGIGDAFAVPPIYAIFTRHIDSGSEGYEWSLYSSFSFGAGSAVGGLLASLLVGTFGPRGLFLINGSFMLLGIVIIIFLRPYLRPRGARLHGQPLIDHRRV